MPYCSYMSIGIEAYNFGLLGKRSVNGCWYNLRTQRKRLEWSAVKLLAMHLPPLKVGIGSMHKERKLIGHRRYPKMKRFSKTGL